MTGRQPVELLAERVATAVVAEGAEVAAIEAAVKSAVKAVHPGELGPADVERGEAAEAAERAAVVAVVVPADAVVEVAVATHEEDRAEPVVVEPEPGPAPAV